MEDFLSVLDWLLYEAGGKDELIDALQELEPPELTALCENVWILKLIVAYCEGRK